MHASPYSSGPTSYGILILPLFIVVGFFLGAFMLRTTPSAKGEHVAGWCCTETGQRCQGGMIPDRCGSDGGIAFSSDQMICDVACVSSAPSHGPGSAAP